MTASQTEADQTPASSAEDLRPGSIHESRKEKADERSSKDSFHSIALSNVIKLLQARGLVSNSTESPSYQALTQINGNVLAAGASFRTGHGQVQAPEEAVEGAEDLICGSLASGYSVESVIAEISSILKNDMIIGNMASVGACDVQTEAKEDSTESQQQTPSTAQYSTSTEVAHSAVEHANCVHHEDLETFGTDLVEACRSGIGKDTRYKGVYVLLVSWGKADDLSVHYELDLLEEVFRSRYDFDVERFVIPNNRNPTLHTSKAIDQFQLDHEDPENLYIIYYGGHGSVGSDQCCYFHPNLSKRDKDKYVDWNPIQSRLTKAEQDVLVLLDCCSAGAAVTQRGTNKSTTEVLGAGAREVPVPGVGLSSFTQRLLSELWYTRAEVLHVDTIASTLVPEAATHNDETQPFYWPVSGRNFPSIGLRVANTLATPRNPGKIRPQRLDKLTPSTTGLSNLRILEDDQDDSSSSQGQWNSSTGLTEADSSEPREPHRHRALIAIHTTKDMKVQDFKLLDWYNWMKAAPEGVIGLDEVKFEGDFTSGSSLLIISMPIKVWFHLRDDTAYNFIGFMRSSNLLIREDRSNTASETVNLTTPPISIPEDTVSKIQTGIQQLKEEQVKNTEILNRFSSFHEHAELKREGHFKNTQEILNQLFTHINGISYKVEHSSSFVQKKSGEQENFIKNMIKSQHGKEKQKAREKTLKQMEDINNDIKEVKDILVQFRNHLGMLGDEEYLAEETAVTEGRSRGSKVRMITGPSSTPVTAH